ncbi:hypothetical protein M2347_002700 [Chryseobacterium sp. H1D6B]|nr:hypothetical protein [Chryseobacterium sp. H1D6B]MDH6252973.1 hypothetical protein [Chryseobacterium sp. H1D6B]
MKNLKKLNRAQQKEIQGGALARCTTNSQCFGAWCCDGRCVPQACIQD